MNIPTEVVNYIGGLGLGFTISLMIAFKAGQIRGLTMENLHEKIDPLTLQTLGEQIKETLQSCFDLKMPGVPPGQHFVFPRECSLDRIVSHIQADGDLAFLRALYQSLETQGINSDFFLHAYKYFLIVTI